MQFIAVLQFTSKHLYCLTVFSQKLSTRSSIWQLLVKEGLNIKFCFMPQRHPFIEPYLFAIFCIKIQVDILAVDMRKNPILKLKIAEYT